MRRTLAILFAVTITAFTLTACTASDAAPVNGKVNDGAIIIDVRTPGEYAGGHLEGAKLIDFNAGEVATAIPTLDPNAEYLIYCRSGNRSGQALDLMKKAGFSNLTNLGSLDEAAATTGIKIVK